MQSTQIGCRHTSVALMAVVALSLTGGCSTIPEGAAKTEAPVAEVDDKPGAQLWAENCTRCHNLRSPANFTPTQWSIVVHEMRVRAGLTGVEQRKILEFLKASSSGQSASR